MAKRDGARCGRDHDRQRQLRASGQSGKVGSVRTAKRGEERKLRTDGEAVVHSSRRRDVTAPIMMMFCPTLCCGTVIS